MSNNAEPRRSNIERKTGETSVALSLNLDGEGRHEISTGNGMLDHLLAQLSRHGHLDITLNAEGDLLHGLASSGRGCSDLPWEGFSPGTG